MTRFLSVLGKGSSGDSKKIAIKKMEKSSESPLLPSLIHPLTHRHPERIHPAHFQIFQGVRWMSRGISQD
jgi:hypothetical protein